MFLVRTSEREHEYSSSITPVINVYAPIAKNLNTMQVPQAGHAEISSACE